MSKDKYTQKKRVSKKCKGCSYFQDNDCFWYKGAKPCDKKKGPTFYGYNSK